MEGDSDAAEIHMPERVTIWDETDSLLLSRDDFIEIGNIAQKVKPTLEGVSEVIKTCNLHRVILGNKSISIAEGVNSFLEFV